MENEIDCVQYSKRFDSFWRVDDALAVRFKDRKRIYEYSGVPDATWCRLLEVNERARKWHLAGTWAPKKPESVSIGRFYEKEIADRFPMWEVELEGGESRPINALAHAWEVANGPRGVARAAPHWIDGPPRRWYRPTADPR